MKLLETKVCFFLAASFEQSHIPDEDIASTLVTISITANEQQKCLFTFIVAAESENSPTHAESAKERRSFRGDTVVYLYNEGTTLIFIRITFVCC